MPKKIPMRQCAGCREMKPKNALVRIVRSPEGGIFLDSRGKLSGRGVYLCPSQDCLRRAQKTRALERSLDTAIPEEIYAALAERMAADE